MCPGFLENTMIKKLYPSPSSWDRIIGTLSVTLLIVGVTLDALLR